MVPDHLYGGYEEFLVGRVDAPQGGPEADHVHVGIFLAEEAALQSGVDGAYDGLLAEEALVGIDGNLQQRALGVEEPAGVARVGLGAGTGELEDRADDGAGVETLAREVAALHGADADDVAVEPHAGQIGRGLDEVGDVLAHGEDAVGHADEGFDEAVAGGLVDDLGLFGLAAHLEPHVRLGDEIFLFELGGQHVEVCAHLFLIFHGHAADGVAVARNGVVEAAALDVNQAHAVVEVLVEHAGQELVGVGAFLLDVVAGMAAHQALHLDLEEETAGGCGLFLHVEEGLGVGTAGAADEDFAFVLRVKVEQVLAGHEAGLDARGTAQAGLFGAGEEAFDGAVLYAVVGEQGHLHGHADAVVGTEGGALGLHPVAVDVGLDGVVLEVEVQAGHLFADHVHVALHHGGLEVFIARRGRFADEHVARLVLQGLQAQLVAEVHEVGHHLFFLVRRAGYLVHLGKAVEHDLGLQLCLFHFRDCYIYDV